MDSALEKNEKNIKPKGWTPLLVLVCFCTTMGTAIPVGYFLGVLNTPAVYIKAWCETALASRYDAHLSSFQLEMLWATIVSIFLIGGICGSFLGGGYCNKFGRKGSMLVSASLLLFAGCLLYFCRLANSVEMLLLGRFIAGIAAALIYTALPMYLLEIAPTHLRGSVAVFPSIGVTGGICVGQVFSLQQVFGSDALWEYALSFYTVLVVLCYLPVYWFPESPRWLYLVKYDEQAARVQLERLRGKNADDCICSEMADMKAAATMASTEKTSFVAVIKNRELLLPLVLVCSLQITQQLTGINAIFFYSVPILTKGGLSVETATWMNFGAGFLNLLFAAISPLMMYKFNRRPLILLSTAGCGLSLIGMAFALFYIDLASWVLVLSIVFIALFIYFFNLGLAPIPYFIGSELFEVAPRSVAMSMGSLFSWIGNFMIGMFFPMLESVMSTLAFLPCAVICLSCCLLVWRYLPETRGHAPADVKPYIKDGFKSKRNH